MSIHPTTPDAEVDFLLHAVEEVARHGERWGQDYVYCSRANEFRHRERPHLDGADVEQWFEWA